MSVPFIEKFDYDRFVRDALSVVGGRGSGKSTIVKLVIKNSPKDWLFRIFDMSSAWDSSPIAYKIIIPANTWLPQFEDISVTYDIGLAYPSDYHKIISNLIKREWEWNWEERHQIVYILEESEMYLNRGFLRSKAGQEFRRMVAVGRNNNMTYISLTQKPQMIDNDLWELCGQQLYGKFQRIDYLRSIIGNESAERTKSLNQGEFIYYVDGITTLVQGEKVNSKKSLLIDLGEPI